MKTKLYLTRHGETDWNRAGRYQGQMDIPLNQKGREQAKALAQALKDLQVDGIWSSDLARAKETAEIVASQHNAQVQTHKDLREMNFGKWQGMTYTEIEKAHPKQWQKWTINPEDYHIPGGETLEQLEERFTKALESICNQYVGKTVLVVAHGGPISRLLAKCTSGNFWEMMHGNCAYSLLEYSPETGFVYLETCQAEGKGL